MLLATQTKKKKKPKEIKCLAQEDYTIWQPPPHFTPRLFHVTAGGTTETVI